MRDLERINRVLQGKLKQTELNSIKAVAAAKWLSQEGVLRDSPARPGKPLRDLLRQGRITGQRQASNGRWFIDRETD